MKLKKQFSDFYKYIRIDREQDTLIEKREILQRDIENRLPREMEEHGITLKCSDIRFFDQGSYKYNTTITADVVDRDVAVMIPLNVFKYTDPRKIKIYLKHAITIPSRTVLIKEPCVRASYTSEGKEFLHIDLPLYAKCNSSIYLARGHETGTYQWEPADPDGLNNDLCNRINNHDQLRRIICYIKKWKNETYKYARSDHEIPPSIGLTYLACDCFSQQTSFDGDDDLLALQKTMKGIKEKFFVKKDIYGQITSANIARYLTVQPYTDIFQKMRNSSERYMVTFYQRLSSAVDNLTNAINVESDHDAGVYVQKVLGNEFVIPPKQVASTLSQSRREHSFG